MASSDSASPLPVALAPSAPKKENITPVGSKIAELNESRTELLNRIQGLKQELKNWRSKLDTQVKIYREELSELKNTLNVEVEQLRTEFQELRNTLHQQHEDVTDSLRNLGYSNPTLVFSARIRTCGIRISPSDSSPSNLQAEDPKVEGKDEEMHTSSIKENGNEVNK